MLNLAEIKEFFKGEIRLNEPMKNHCTMKIGGPADFFFIPENKKDIIGLVAYHQGKNIPYYVLGNGSNILVGDKGIRGSVVALADTLDYIKIEDDLITVGAGYNLPKFVLECLKNGFEGIEGLGGIPGTIGGAVIMNAGAYGVEIFNFITRVELIRNGKHEELSRDEIQFGYRYTNLPGSVILEMTVRLPKAADPKASMEKRQELLRKRNESQPLDKPNAGSIFKNPQGNFAAKLTEACGLKGFRVGDAMVSEKHANFFVNMGNATAEDMMKLIEHVRMKVKEKFGMEMEMEVKRVGEF